MSAGCCEDKAVELAHLRVRQARVLQLVLAINAAMFVLEFGVGVWSRSTALLADSLDMLGDAAVYGFSLYVLGRGAMWEARAAMLKGIIMLAFGTGVAADAGVKAFSDVVPVAEAMGGVGLVALAANTACLLLLLRHRSDGLNMRSTWLCSRNDVIANVGVLFAAAAVGVLDSKWPDLVVGGVVASLFLASATAVLRDTRSVRTAAPRPVPVHPVPTR